MANKVEVETFVLSHAEGHIVYSPLARALHGRHELSDDETSFLEQSGLGRTFIESPNLSLSVPEDEAFCPTCVSLYLTDACNLACTYCYAHGGRNRIPCKIPLDAARAAIRPTGVIVVSEPGRALQRHEIEHALGAPVQATAGSSETVAWTGAPSA